MTIHAKLSSAGDCEVHAYHRPNINRGGLWTIESHHIHPREYGGPDGPSNRVRACPTGHSAIHELLRALVKADGVVPWSVRQHYSAKERYYAEEGYRRIVAANKVGVAKAAVRGKTLST